MNEKLADIKMHLLLQKGIRETRIEVRGPIINNANAIFILNNPTDQLQHSLIIAKRVLQTHKIDVLLYTLSDRRIQQLIAGGQPRLLRLYRAGEHELLWSIVQR